MNHRIFGTALVLLSILVLPYWIYIPILLVAIIYFPFYWEGLILALIIEVIYDNGVGFLPSLVSPLALSALIMLIILLPIKDKLRLHV